MYGPGISGRIDRLRQIVARFIKQGLTPQSNLFGQRVYEICCGEFGLRKSTSQQYAEALGISWRKYHWVNWVRGNSYMSKEDRAEWMRKVEKERSQKP